MTPVFFFIFTAKNKTFIINITLKKNITNDFISLRKKEIFGMYFKAFIECGANFEWIYFI